MVEKMLDDIIEGITPKLTQCIAVNLRSLMEGVSFDITIKVHLKCTERYKPEFFSCTVGIDK